MENYYNKQNTRRKKSLTRIEEMSLESRETIANPPLDLRLTKLEPCMESVTE